MTTKICKAVSNERNVKARCGRLGPLKHRIVPDHPTTATSMKVTTIFQNMQGLNNPLKLDTVRNYYRPMFGDMDLLCIQEHHLGGPKLTIVGRSFWPQATFMREEAAVGFGHASNEARAGTGRVGLWLAPRITHLASETGHSQCK